jgi:hypothetical protein
MTYIRQYVFLPAAGDLQIAQRRQSDAQPAAGEDMASPARNPSQSVRHPTLSKISRALSSGKSRNDHTQQSQPFFSALEDRVDWLMHATLDDLYTQDAELQRICRQLPHYLFTPQQMAALDEKFQAFKTSVLTGLLDNDNDAQPVHDTAFLAILDCLSHIDFAVFKHLEPLGDAELRRLAHMLAANSLSLFWQEKAIRHLQRNLHHALPGTGKYLLDMLQNMPVTHRANEIQGVIKRLETDAVQWYQKVHFFTLTVQRHIATLTIPKTRPLILEEDFLEMIDEIENDEMYAWKFQQIHAILQNLMKQINFKAVYGQGKKIFIHLVRYLHSLVKKVYHGKTPVDEELMLTWLGLMAQPEVSDKSCMALGKLIQAYVSREMFYYAERYQSALDNITRPSLPFIIGLLKKKHDNDPQVDQKFSAALQQLIGEAQQDEIPANHFIVEWKWPICMNKGGFACFQKTAHHIVQTQEKADASTFKAVLDCLETIRLEIFGIKRFFFDDFLLNLADRMNAIPAQEECVQSIIQIIDANLYSVSDATAILLRQKINKISCIDSMPALDALKTRLEKLPAARIPKMFKWIWRGGAWSNNTITQMIKFHEMNPGHRIIAYSFNRDDIYSAIDQYAAQIPLKDVDGVTMQARIAQASELRKVLEIRDRNVLNDEPIHQLLKQNAPGQFSRLDAIAERNGENTATTPNYPTITDIERLAVLHREGGIYVDHNCQSRASIHEHARAEAGLAGQVYLTEFRQLEIDNNAILAAPENSAEIEALLRFINDNYDKPGHKKSEQEKAHFLDAESWKWKFAPYLERMDGMNAPLTWTIGRFSYPSPPSSTRNLLMHGTSRHNITLFSTGPNMLRRVMRDRWQTSHISHATPPAGRRVIHYAMY